MIDYLLRQKTQWSLISIIITEIFVMIYAFQIMNIQNCRGWMYNKYLPDKSGFNPQFLVGLKDFIQFACKQPQYVEDKELRCPGTKNRNTRLMDPDNVVDHILRNSFMP